MVFPSWGIILFFMVAWETNSPEFVKTLYVGVYTNSGEFVSQAAWLARWIKPFYNVQCGIFHSFFLANLSYTAQCKCLRRPV